MKNKSFSAIGITVLTMMLFLTSCVDESGREGRALIKDFTTSGAQTGCGDQLFHFSTGDTCVDNCPEGTHVATADEITTLTTDATEEIKNIVAASKGVCADDVVEIVRPSEVFVQSDICACKTQKAASVGNCTTVCAGKDSKTETILFGSVKVGPGIELNDKMKTLHGWCNNEIGDGKTSPQCSLEVKDASGGVQNLNVTTFANSNNFQADVTSLSLDKTFILKIKESQSGSEAESDSFQLRLKDIDSDDSTSNDPLKTVFASQYTCLTRAGKVGDDGNIYTDAARIHFYFNNKNIPPALAAGNDFLFCHDVNTYGKVDSILYPRLELKSQHLALWDPTDVKFVDQDGNGSPDVDTILANKLKEEFNVIKEPKLFWQLAWPNVPNSQTPGLLGYVMIPWINQTTGRSFCPTRYDYQNSSDPVLRVLNGVVGNDTEAIYLSKKEPVSLPDDDDVLQPQPDDILIIRENVLKKIWFYFENGQHYTPDEVTATQKTVHFYWPPDYANPHTKKPNQKLFTVRAPNDLGDSGNSGVGTVPTTITPQDKRIGCIPSLGEPATN